MTTNICFSGGAVGADTLFSEEAAKAGHKVVNYTFDKHKTFCDPSTLVKLSMFYLIQADPFLKEANSKFLHRKFPSSNDYVDNLLRRNYYQIGDTDKIYAVASIGARGMVSGGTSWAVSMAVCNGIKDIYVFDVITGYWMSFIGINNNEFKWRVMTVSPSSPSGKYTGIGSRDLPENGRCAIQSLYGSLSNEADK